MYVMILFFDMEYFKSCHQRIKRNGCIKKHIYVYETPVILYIIYTYEELV